MLLRTKKIFFYILIAILAISNISCTKETDKNVGESSVSGGKNPSLTIYLKGSSDKKYADALGIYEGVEIKARYFADMEEYTNKITTEILSGVGPDIFKISNYDFNSVPKLMSSGALSNLDSIINEDKEFDLANYNKTVLNSGVYDGKRYLIPLDFSMLAFYTTKTTLNRNGIQINSENWNWDTMVETAGKTVEANKGTGKFLFQPDYDTVPYFMHFMLGSEIKFFNSNTKKSNFNSAEFIELLKVYKEKIYPAVCPGEIAKNLDAISLLQNGKVVMLYNGAFNYGGVQELCKNNSFYKRFTGEDIEVYPIPAFKTKKGVNAVPYDAMGINSKCKYKKAAFEYIKRLLSEEYYKQNYNYNYYAAVNNRAFEEEIKYYTDSSISFGTYSSDKGAFDMVSIPKRLSEQLESVVNNIRQCEFDENGISKIVRGELKKYLEGAVTAEQCAKTINDKCIIYLNE